MPNACVIAAALQLSSGGICKKQLLNAIKAEDLPECPHAFCLTSRPQKKFVVYIQSDRVLKVYGAFGE